MNPNNPAFIITIDTEGDNIWARPRRVTTENARYLPRFQELCEEYGLKVTYLVNYEMATDACFQEFGCSVVRREVGEIGLHVHPWDSPPIVEMGYDTSIHHTYLYELSPAMINDKVEYLTKLLSDTFDIRPISHRAGRWGFDEGIARTLVDFGYLVDCSVAPGASWKRYKGAPNGSGGPDYYGFPSQPYFLDLNDIRQSGRSQLLEVPVTIRPNYHPALQTLHHSIEDGTAGKVLRRVFGPPGTWLRPNGRNLEAMLSLVDWAVGQEFPVLEFMLHSSELMPGGSPTFKTAEQIDSLYEHLSILFARVMSLGACGMTLGEYRYRMDERAL